MIKIVLADWLLGKSDTFKEILSNLRDHKINTKNSFSRVKDKHRDYEAKVREQDARIRELEGIVDSLNIIEEEIPIIKKSRKKKKGKK